MCVWPEPALLRGVEVPIPALLAVSLSSAVPALLKALAVPRDLTGTIQLALLSAQYCTPKPTIIFE